MKANSQSKTILILSLPLAILVIIISCVGILTPGFYSKETTNWQVQSLSQDIVDLFLVIPCLLITSALAFRNNKMAILVWGGVVLYLTYTFVIYCFAVHFNKLFILYCFSLGLSFYSLVYFLFTQNKEISVNGLQKKPIIRFIAYYFFILSALFYFQWLSEIIPATIHNSAPKSVVNTGLFTNPVQVIDLSVFYRVFHYRCFIAEKKTGCFYSCTNDTYLLCPDGYYSRVSCFDDEK